MKKILILIISAVLLILPSCSEKQKNEGHAENTGTTVLTSATVTQKKAETDSKPLLTREEQKQLLTDYLKKQLETQREDANGRFVLGEGNPFDLQVKNDYYSFYDIDGDSVLELIRGYKDEKYFNFIKEEELGSIIINNIIYISESEAVNNNYCFNVPGSDIYGVPVIYGNGIIRDGGKDSENYQEFYYYIDCKGMVISCLRHFFKTDSDKDKYEVWFYENGVVTSTQTVSEEEFFLNKSEIESESVNAELEWCAITDFL